jgi:hypothetical protein
VTATDWMPTLQDQLDRARHLLGGNASPTPGAADQAGQALRQASDALMAVFLEFGVETPLGWRLHQLRSRLDAHLLAASALAEADAQEAVIIVLRRSLDVIGPELKALSTTPVGVNGGLSPCS